MSTPKLRWFRLAFAATAGFFSLPPATRAQSAPAGGGSEMSQLQALLDTPISGASKREQSLLTSPQAIEVLTGEEIRRQGIYRLADALRLLTSVEVIELDQYATYVGIRGIMQEGQPRTVQILVDGVPLYNSELGSIDLNLLPVPVDLIDRVEVVRGPSSALYGANAVAGVIAITTLRPDAGTGGGARVTRANDATTRGAAHLHWAQGGWVLTAGASGDSVGATHGVAHNLGYQDVIPYDADSAHGNNAFARAGWSQGPAALWFESGEGYNKTWSPNAPVNLFYEYFDTTIAQAGWRQKWSERLHSEVTVSRTATRYTTSPSSTAAAQLQDPGFNGVYTWFDYQNLKYAAQVNWDPAATLHIVAGADHTDLKAKPALFGGLREETKESASGGFLSIDWSFLPQWTISLGGRAENESLGGSRKSPRAVLLFAPNDRSSVRLGYYDSTRSPQIFDGRVNFANIFLNYCPAPFPPGTFCTYDFQILPNSSLKPERIRSVEAGYRQSVGRFTGDLTIFRMKFDDLITQVNLAKYAGAPILPGTIATLYIPTQNQNGGSATNLGAELAAQWQASAAWSLGGNATWLDYNRDEAIPVAQLRPYQDARKFPYAPQFRGNLWLRYSGKRLSGEAAYQHVGATIAEALQVGGVADFEPRPAINQLHGVITWQLPWWQGFYVAAHARNAAREATSQGAGGATRVNDNRYLRREYGLTFGWKH